MKQQTLLPVITALFLGWSSSAEAGGLYLYELGTEDVGLANAGAAARAQDASTIANNPAGMTRLQGDQLTVGVQALYGDFDYSMNESSQLGPGNVVGVIPGASTFYSHSVSDDLKLGMALFGNYGLSLSYGGSWAGHYLVKEATLMGITLQPSLAYRINNQWSLGGGPGVNYGIFSLTRDKLTGGDVELDDTDVALNMKMGVLFEPTKNTRLGLTYTSEVDYDFDIDASGTLPITNNAWTLPIQASVDAPQQVLFSAVQVLSERWTLLGSIGWQDWSSFSEAEVTVGPITRSSSLDLQDTWHGSLGVQYALNPATRLDFGIAYDTSMYENQDHTSLFLPSGAVWRFGAGVLRQLNDRASLGFAFEYLTFEDARVSSPDVLAGRYDDPQMCFFAVNYSYRF